MRLESKQDGPFVALGATPALLPKVATIFCMLGVTAVAMSWLLLGESGGLAFAAAVLAGLLVGLLLRAAYHAVGRAAWRPGKAPVIEVLRWRRGVIVGWWHRLTVDVYRMEVEGRYLALPGPHGVLRIEAGRGLASHWHAEAMQKDLDA